MSGSPWLVQVATQQAPARFSTGWVPAEQIGLLRDPAPREGPGKQGVRHVWVKQFQLPMQPALLVDWRRAGEGWEALVVEASADGIHVGWAPVGDVVQVADDGVREV